MDEMKVTVSQLIADTKPVRVAKPMGLYLYPSELLLTESKPWITSIKGNEELQNLLDDMIETVKQTRAMGLSAIQVGIPTQIFIINDNGRNLVFINPTVKHMPDSVVLFEKEGCLSFPGAFECVRRDSKVEVSGLDREGGQFTVTLEGDSARAAQHEMDHLEGVLFTSRMSMYKREAALKTLKTIKKKLFKDQ